MQWLLVTDLDNTLVGDEAALIQLNARLTQARQQHGALLAYATGRSLTSYRQLCTTAPLLPPDVLVTAVGTEIYTDTLDHPNPHWSAKLEQRWDRALVAQIAAQFTALHPQPEPEQRPFKVSYFLQAAIAPLVIAELATALQAAGLSTQLIYSGSKDLDILPEAADKGKALRFLQAQFTLADQQIVACGDSGNDIALFGENRGIIVGNAQPELLQWHRQNPASHRYLATNYYAAGILEGLRYFGMLS